MLSTQLQNNGRIWTKANWRRRQFAKQEVGLRKITEDGYQDSESTESLLWAAQFSK